MQVLFSPLPKDPKRTRKIVKYIKDEYGQFKRVIEEIPDKRDLFLATFPRGHSIVVDAAERKRIEDSIVEMPNPYNVKVGSAEVKEDIK